MLTIINPLPTGHNIDIDIPYQLIKLFNNFLYGILICSGSRIEMMEVTFMNKKYNIEKVAEKVVSFLDCISLNGRVCHCSLLEFDTEVGVL